MNVILKACFVFVAVVVMTGCVSTASKPADRVLESMENSERLISWASDNGAGLEVREGYCGASAGKNRRSDEYCRASNSGSSAKLGNQYVLPPRARPNMMGQQHQQQYQSNRRHYNNGTARSSSVNIGVGASGGFSTGYGSNHP